MRIEEEPSSSAAIAEMPPASAELLRRILATTDDEDFVTVLNSGREVHAIMGKTELNKWIEVLNRIDDMLAKAIVKNEAGMMRCELDATHKQNATACIRFTVLLFECTSSRRIYKSVDRILALLESQDMDLIAETLRLLQVMGKRSKFLSTRIHHREQAILAHHVTAIAQCWGGKLRSVKMAEAMKREPKLPVLFPFTFTDSSQRVLTVDKPKFQEGETVPELIVRTVAQLNPSADSSAQIMTDDDRYCLKSRLRTVVHFDEWHHRFKCVIVRLLSVSTLVYCRLHGTDDNAVNSILYPGFVEEIVDLLKAEKDPLQDAVLIDGIQTEALSTLCSIVTYEKEPKIQAILEALSANSYHGFLSVMTRQIVDELKSNHLGKPNKPSVSLATALFSFIYHLASIEPGGDTLVSSGLTQTLLGVISYHNLPIDCITFGTRCARIIDLFTTIDVGAFKANNGMEICINRVVYEVNECRKEQPFIIDISNDVPFVEDPEPERAEGEAPPAAAERRGPEDQDDEEDEDDLEAEFEAIHREHQQLRLGMLHDHLEYDPSLRPRLHQLARVASAAASAEPAAESSSSTTTARSEPKVKGGPWETFQHNGTSCHQQRSGLIKGLLTFIKRAIGDVQFQDVMRHLMEGDLPEALMHIISNAEYYSPSLFHQSAHLITNFVYQFPDELKSIQRRHVPYVLFQSLLRKELPNSKDVITTLGNVFTAMCLNERGLRQFKSYDPFDQIFRIVLSVKFLVTLRKKRSADTFESAQAIGGALDDLMRHYPDLKHDMLKSIIIILDLLDDIGRNPPPGVELVPTLTKSMARSVTATSSNTVLPREAYQRIEEDSRASAAGGVVEQADERVGNDPIDEGVEPMEVGDGEDSEVDEEDNEMSIDETSAEAPAATPAAPSPKPVIPKPFEYGDGMTCEDANGKKMLPIGDYMLLIAKVIETMMTQQPTQKLIEEFLEHQVIQKIMKLCHLSCIANENMLNAYINNISTIVKHIMKTGFTSTRNPTPDAGPKLMSAIVGEFIKTMNPVFETPTPSADFSGLKPSETKKATILMHVEPKLVERTLIELNSIIPILLNLNKNIVASYAQSDTRNRLFESWKMPDGMKLYGMLRKLSRMLCWEHELIQTLKPPIKSAGTQTDRETEEQEPEPRVSEVEVLPPNEEETTSTEQKKVQEEIYEPRWKAAGVSQEEHDFWQKNKPLQETIAKSHNLVKELLNSLGKQMNMPSHRRSRPRESQNLPLAATQCISMIFTSIYKDLKWEAPGAPNSPMAYGRYMDLLNQLNQAIFESNQRPCQNPALIQNFYTSGCHKAFFELFSEKIVPYLGYDMPPGVEKCMEEWCKLATRLTDGSSISQNDPTMPPTRRDRNSEFDPIKYSQLVCRDTFNVYKQFFDKMAVMPDWEIKTLKKICENAFSVFKEVAKNLVEEVEIAKATPPPPVPTAQPAAPAAPAAPNPGGPANDLEEDQILMLMDLGFDRDIVIYAIRNTRTPDEAANYLLTHGHEMAMMMNPGARLREALGQYRENPVGLMQAVEGRLGAANAQDSAANADEIETQLNVQLAELNGYQIVTQAQRVLGDYGLEVLGLVLLETFPDDQAEISAQRVIEEAMDLIRNPRNNYDDNIATPLIPPLSQLKIEQDVSLGSACKQLFPLVKRLLMVSSDLVHPCADIIIAIFPAMTEEWRKEHLISQLIGSDLKKLALKVAEQDLDENEHPLNHSLARTMSNRLHFAVLCYDHVAEEYIEWINEHDMVTAMLGALEFLTPRLKTVDYYQALVTRIICWFDYYAKISRLVVRRKYLQSLTPSLEWYYQMGDEEPQLRRRNEQPEKKWLQYDVNCQKVLNDAFFSGNRWATIHLRRNNRALKKFEVDFIAMRQYDNVQTRENIRGDIPAKVNISIEDLMASEASLVFSEEQNYRLLALSVKCLHFGSLDPKCAYSVLGFLARHTHPQKVADKFMDLKGLEAMMRLRARSSASTQFLASMIVRNCIEDDALAGYIFEKTFRGYISTTTQQINMTDYSATTKQKDFVESLQLFSAMTVRNPRVFADVVVRNASMQGNDILAVPREKMLAAAAAVPSTSIAPSSSTNSFMGNDLRASTVISMLIEEVLVGDFPTSGQQRVLSRDRLLGLLAELIKSYPTLAIVVAETKHEGKSALHSLIDTYIGVSSEKPEITSCLKTLIAVICSVQVAAKAHEMIVSDVKSALNTYSAKALEVRAEGVHLQQENVMDREEKEEALKKHHQDEKQILQKISEICSIIVIMCQNCPLTYQHPPGSRGREPQHDYNAVMKLFHKKKICADLVKTIHCLRLCTKESTDAVNNILKTLDILLDGCGLPSSPTPSSTPSSRSIIDMMADRHRRREPTAVIAERELDTLFGGHDFGLDGEMRQLLRRLNDDVMLRPRGARPAAANEEDEGSETSARERSDSPSEASEQGGDDQQAAPEVRDDAVDTGEGGVGAAAEANAAADVAMEDGIRSPREGASPAMSSPIPPIEEDVDSSSDSGEEEEDSDSDQVDDVEADVLDDVAEDADAPEDHAEDEDEEEDDQDDIDAVEQNPEPPVRRLLIENPDDDDEDNDDDNDSLTEEDVNRMDMEDDYFDIGAFGEMSRFDDVLFQPSFARMGGHSFSDLFRDEMDFFRFRSSRPTYRAALERRSIPRTTLGTVTEHPLMVRPHNENDPPRRHMGPREGPAPSSRHALHRQNAIRRTITEVRGDDPLTRVGRIGELPSGRVILRGPPGSGADLHNQIIDHIFELRPSHVPYHRMPYAARFSSSLRDGDERRDVRASQIPNILERLDSYMHSMDPNSARYVIVIVNSYLTALHKSRESDAKAEAEVKARAKRDAEAAKKAAEAAKKAARDAILEETAARNAAEVQARALATGEAPAPVESGEVGEAPMNEDIGLATPAATNTTNTVSEAVAPNAARVEDTATTAAPQVAPAPAPVEVVEQVAEPVEEQAPQDPPQDPRLQEQPVESNEPMETVDGDLGLPASSAATAASSVAGVEELEEVEREAQRVVQERQAMGIEEPPIENAPNPPAQPIENPVQEANVMPEEFRAILGDIDIPDGVDPAFLAALPEDMRAEVIRDYQRQQRAERATRPAPAAPAAPAQPADAQAAGGEAAPDAAQQPANPAAPLVEPIDPVFLNALPPDLQEEVLAEHERRLREAQDQLRRQNDPPAVPQDMDGAAVIASLPINERAQVLAEMDETELARLPADMQNEARRARATHAAEPNMMRYHRFLFRNGGPVGVGMGGVRPAGAGRASARAAATGPTVGAQAGNAHQAPANNAQVLDRESILTICLLYLVDNNRVPHTRLQKVLRSACVNQSICDFIVWCLLALLDKASESNLDDEEFQIVSHLPAWLDSISVSGVGQNERALKISENAQKVSVHSMLAIPMCKNILDLLASIARAYPGNFIPAVLRCGGKPEDVTKLSPSFKQFWSMVQNSSKVPKCKDWKAPPEQQLEECPLGQMLNSLQKPIMAKTGLKEKVLKVASQIMVTLPMNTLTLMKIKPEDGKKPMSAKLEYVIRAMTTGACSPEGLNDGLTILSEAMRTFDESTSTTIYEHLFAAVTNLGGELLPQIDRLIVELDEAQGGPPDVVSKPSTSKATHLVVDVNAAGGRTARGRFDGERLVIDGEQNMRLQMSSCKELQLPAVTLLTDKGGSQYALLSALQTLVKVRNHMKAIRKDRLRRAQDKKMAEDLKKIEAEKKAKQEAAAAAAAAPPAQEPASGDGTAEPAPPAQPTTEAAPATPAASAAPASESVPSTSDDPAPAPRAEYAPAEEEPRISERLASLESLWNSLSECLLRLGKASDPHAVLALQPAAEAFFLVHASQQYQKPKKDAEAKRKESQAGTSGAVASSVSHDGLRDDLDQDTAKLIEFAEKHRQVLNQALRQNNAVLTAGGPFAILTQFPKLLDFDVKRKFFRKELTKLEPTMPRYRRNDVSVQVSRNRVFSDSFRELFRLRPADWKNRFYIIFNGEEGQDAGGLLREWFSVITREIFNPNYALFITAPGDMVTYMINKASHINPEHLDYFKFVGRLIAKSVFEHKYLDCYFTRAFYKHILNLPVRYQDLESEDPAFFKSLDFLLQNPIDDLGLDLTFSTDVEEFGVQSIRDLKPNGRKIEVNDANKEEYVKLVCQMKMTGSIRKQLDAFLTGFYEIIPKDLISMFNEQELELLISGLPTVDIDDMAANTEYKGYQRTSTMIQWFWRALRSFDKEDKAKFLQFVTGTSKVPLQGFASLEGMNGIQKFSIHNDSRGGDRLPAAHTCFNQLDLPQYESYEKLRQQLLLAIRECTEGFGFA